MLLVSATDATRSVCSMRLTSILTDFFSSFAVVGMAQDFVGSNNINLLTPSGQFGTRLMGGSDAASPRYIFTHLSPFARLLFPDVDDMVSLCVTFLHYMI